MLSSQIKYDNNIQSERNSHVIYYSFNERSKNLKIDNPIIYYRICK